MSRTQGRTVRIRILATSDLHMQVTPYDYIKDRPTQTGSLARLSTLIKRMRREAAVRNQLCLLFDNGDTFQGTPMAEVLAADVSDDTHPMIAAMNAWNGSK